MARCGVVGRWSVVVLALGFLCGAAAGQDAGATADSDQDGMSDAVEQALLVQFAPTFVVGRHDCAGVPAEFAPDVAVPTAMAEDGTIYGQVIPVGHAIQGGQVIPNGRVIPDGQVAPGGEAAAGQVLPVGGAGSGAGQGAGQDAGSGAGQGASMTAEIHFYHLWSRDCGPHGHRLDAEHVAVLVTAPGHDPAGAQWKAVYWYAAAHEKTVCEVSQITRASTVHAEESGARVWISPGKHASYLNETLCRGGCGADRCVDMTALPRGRIVNLGEAGHPMNGSAFIASAEWPLEAKMTTSNFPPEALARLNQMPESDIAWFNAGRHPAQGIIADSNATEQAIAGGAGDTAESLALAGNSTGAAISVAQDDTGNALAKSYRNTVHGLGAAARGVGKALGVRGKTEKAR